MRKEYIKPDISIVPIEVSDIITASVGSPVDPEIPVVKPGGPTGPMDDWE